MHKPVLHGHTFVLDCAVIQNHTFLGAVSLSFKTHCAYGHNIYYTYEIKREGHDNLDRLHRVAVTKFVASVNFMILIVIFYTP